MKQRVKDALARTGLRVTRMSAEERTLYRGYDPVPAPSPADQRFLTNDNPRLQRLLASYGEFESPMSARSMWTDSMVTGDVTLQFFRGDNLYVWQYDRSPVVNRYRYFIYASHIASTDRLGLLERLTEDGAFGCFTFDYVEMPTVSRDLLDSVGELNFLGEHAGLFGRDDLQVLDIGAGYGRLAHRMLEAAPNVSRYHCVDAVPHSTFLNEFYLRHRGLEQRSRVIELPDIGSALQPGQVDLAVNVHSFSEMPMRAIAAWLEYVALLQVPQLLVVPNERGELMSRETDGRRVRCDQLLRDAGYELKVSQPTIQDPAVQDLLNVHDEFLLFERRRGAR